MNGSFPTSTKGKPHYIADRYRLEEKLGSGAMAAVYRVFDEAANRMVALKLLTEDAAAKPQLSTLFEREFHTLAQLAHPLIIEVYDYGVSQNATYYTMELLDGADLRKLAPLDWKEACKLIRDVALSLSLVHSRRFIHRDISSRNVRCTPDGRAKLLDFGAMAPFGTPVKVIGTPAFIAPEALNYQPLDQRTDLYSLGALAYWLITKKHAYRAHYIAHLHDAWRTQPRTLSELNPKVPSALNELVMSLLSLDRMARPLYASEVAEKLTSCAGLKPEDTPEFKHAFLVTPRLVGRGPEITALRKRVLAMLNGFSGETLLFKGPSGIGRSRLLAELVLEGKVIGATVLSTRAEPGERTDYGVVWKLIEQVFENAYDLAIEAVKPNIELICRVFPELSKLIVSRILHRTEETFGLDSFTTDITIQSYERDDRGKPHVPIEILNQQKNQHFDHETFRSQIQWALLDLFIALCRSRRLVIAVDDIHYADDSSVALMSSLALETRKHQFILATTIEEGALSAPTSTLGVLAQVARHIEIENLAPDAIEALLKSIFGDTPNTHVLTERVFAISKGNPRDAMQLARHLVDSGIVCYRSGVWTLPNSIDESDLPNSIADALRERLEQLSAETLELARTLALIADQRVSFDECLILAPHHETKVLTESLNQLIAAEILDTDGTNYAFSHSGWIGVLAEDVDDEIVRKRHLRLSELFSQRESEQFRVVQHLLHAEHFEKALDLLYRHTTETLAHFENKPQAYSTYIRSLPSGWDDTFSYAIEICERLGRPKKELHLLRYIFVRSGFAIGLQSKVPLAPVIDQLYRDSGLRCYDELSNISDTNIRLSKALEITQRRFDTSDESDRVFAPADAIRQLAGAVVAATGQGSLAFDYALVESLPSLEPLLPLSPSLIVIERHVRATRSFTVGRYERARELYLELLEIVSQPGNAGLDEVYCDYVRSAVTYGIGLIESIGKASALRRAEEIESDPLFQVNAWRIRMIYYLRQGNSQKVKKCNKVLEALQVQNSGSQLFENVHLFPAINSYAAYDDLTGVMQTLDSIEAMSERYAGWIPIAHYAHGEYHRIGGDYARALVRFDKVLELTEAGRHSVWPYATGARVRVLFELERLQEAKTWGYQYLEAAEKEELGYLCNLIRMPLALVEAKLGNEHDAESLAETAIEAWIQLGVTGIYLGLAYETRARVAIYTDDPKSFRKFVKLCGEQYQIGQNPILTAKHQKLVQDARHAYAGISRDLAQTPAPKLSLARLAQHANYQALIDRALALVVKRSACISAYLYLLDQGRLKLSGQTDAQTPPQEIVDSMRRQFEDQLKPNEGLDFSETDTQTGVFEDALAEQQVFEVAVLSAKVNDRPLPLGALILRLNANAAFRPDYLLYREVAQSLFEATREKENSREDETEKKTTVTVLENRYLVEVLLGEGGMASVYKAKDRETGRLVALKRARLDTPGMALDRFDAEELAELKKKREDSLRREYQTLKLLAHPRVVEVYDFGVDMAGAYYTMELIEGADLSRFAPIEWKKACAILRDLASALALLHSRRLLHRDLSPRNVRLTPEGQVKLMDFGAMVPMGLSKEHVGTPPFVPPEVVYRQQLDQRSDLYSFGALAYWLMTGRHAYPVRRISELRDAWRNQPARPSSLVERLGFPDEVPEALDQLVMALLSLDPMARPNNAAEVMDRITAIGGLPVEEHLAVPQAYLTTPVLVGRQEPLLKVRKRVIRSLRRRGGTVIVEGTDGVGRSRFVDACVMEGKLAGLVTLKAEAKETRAGDYALVDSLVKQLLDEIPEIALQAAEPHFDQLLPALPSLLFSGRQTQAWIDGTSREKDHTLPNTAPIAERVIEEAHRNPQPAQQHSFSTSSIPDQQNQKQKPNTKNGSLADATDSQETTDTAAASLHRFRPQIQASLREWILEISEKRPLMLAVDDLHAVDEPSAAFLALLTQEVFERRLLIVAAHKPDAATPAYKAINLLKTAGTVIELDNLSQEETEALLSSLFGGAPNIRFLADRFYSISQGRPSVIMQLAQHMMDKNLVRYHAGSWTLPNALNPRDLPKNLVDALKSKLTKLPPYVLEFVRSFALLPDQRFSFDECAILAGDIDSGTFVQTLDELIVSGLLSTDGRYYALSQQSWVSALKDEIDPNSERFLHLRLAEVFEKRGMEQFRVSQHLLLAGEESRALDVLISFCEASRARTRQDPQAYNALIQSLPPDWFETFRTAIRLSWKHERPRNQIYILKSRLHAIGVITGTIDRDYMMELFEQLRFDSGLEFHPGIDQKLDEQERLALSLKLAQQRYDSTPESERVFAPRDAIRELATIVLESAGPVFISADFSLWQTLPSLKPLTVLSPALEISEKLVRAVGHGIVGRIERNCQFNREIVERLDQPDRAKLEGAHYQYLRYGMAFATGIMEASLGLSSALEWIQAIETSSLLEVNACRIRKIYHLWQGASEEAEKCQERIEVLRIQNSPSESWRGTHLCPELRAYCCSDDLSGIRRIINDIENMASEYASWVPTMLYARGERHRIRGDYSRSLDEHRHALELTAAGRHQNWADIAAAYLKTLFAMGKYRDVQREGKAMLQAAANADLEHMLNYLRMPLAVAAAKLNDIDYAIETADAVISYFEKLGSTGLNLGLAHETRAQVAISTRDGESFTTHAKLCAEQFLSGGNPCLIARFEKLIQDAAIVELNSAAIDDWGIVRADSLGTDSAYREIRAQLAACRNSNERANRALNILATNCRAKSGYLFAIQPEGLRLISTQNAHPAPAELFNIVRAYLDAELEDSNEATVTVADEAAAEGHRTVYILADKTIVETVLVYGLLENRVVVVGVAALIPSNGYLQKITPRIIHAISDSFLDKGDVVSRIAVQ